MTHNKSLYSLTEGAEFAKCKVSDLLNFATQNKIKLLVGVPERGNVRIFDEAANALLDPFLLIPEVLTIAQSSCLKIQLNGRSEQSDFAEGYLIEPSGSLKKISPNYGRHELSHRWVYWRTFEDGIVSLIELTPERLFVMQSDLINLINPDALHDQPYSKSRRTKKSNNHADVEQKQSPETKFTSEISTDESSAKKSKTNTKKDESSTPVKSISIIRLKQVQAKTGLSRSAIYDRLDAKSPRHDPSFPKQISLGTGAVGWLESEIEEWIMSRISSERAKTNSNKCGETH